MTCPECGERNPGNAHTCMHCGASFTDRGPAPPATDTDAGASSSSGNLAGWIVFVLLIALVAFKWDTIKEWWWTGDNYEVRCEHLGTHDPSRFPASEGWERFERKRTDERYSKTDVCYRRTYKRIDRVDERFHPDDSESAE